MHDKQFDEVGFRKKSVKGMSKTGRGFQYVRNKFPNVSDAKIKEGIFIGPPDEGTDARQTVR